MAGEVKPVTAKVEIPALVRGDDEGSPQQPNQFARRVLQPVGDVGAFRTGIAVLHHPRAGLHEAPQQRLFRDDARVEAGVGGRRHRRNERVQIRRPADPPQQASAIQLC